MARWQDGGQQPNPSCMLREGVDRDKEEGIGCNREGEQGGVLTVGERVLAFHA